MLQVDGGHQDSTVWSPALYRATPAEHSRCPHSSFPSTGVPGFIPGTRLQTSPSRLDLSCHFVRVRLANPGPASPPRSQLPLDSTASTTASGTQSESHSPGKENDLRPCGREHGSSLAADPLARVVGCCGPPISRTAPPTS